MFFIIDFLNISPFCIQDNHAIIHVDDQGRIIIEKGSPEAKILLNGDPVTSQSVLNHNDRLMFGTTQLYVFKDGDDEVRRKSRYPEITYELAQEEIAAKAGIDLSGDDSRETALLNKDLLEVLPGVEVANSISEELDKKVKFEIMLVSPQMVGKMAGRTEVYIKMKNLETRQEYEWAKEKFLNRLYVMKEMYQNYEADDDWDLPTERDPFLEDPDTEIRIGTVQVFLQSLAYRVELKEQLEIVDYKGCEVGLINVEIVPCSSDGEEYTEFDDKFVDKPDDLIGQDLQFYVKINDCRGIPSRFTDVNCKYRIYLDKNDTLTDTVSDTSNPDFCHKKMFAFHPVTKELLKYLLEGFIVIQVWGKQKPRKSAMAKAKGKNTKQMIQADHQLSQTMGKLMDGFKINGRNVDPNKQSMIVEILLMKKQLQRQQQRIENVSQLIEAAERRRAQVVPLPLLKDLLMTPSAEVAARILGAVFPNAHRRSSPPRTPVSESEDEEGDEEEDDEEEDESDEDEEEKKVSKNEKGGGASHRPPQRRDSEEDSDEYDEDNRGAGSSTCLLL